MLSYVEECNNIVNELWFEQFYLDNHGKYIYFSKSSIYRIPFIDVNIINCIFPWWNKTKLK